MEEIIIDGVNVAECEYCYIVGNIPHCVIKIGLTCNQCEQYQDCYYKQLKRLEQEKSTIEYMLHLKEQENEKLRFPTKDLNYAVLTKEEFEKYTMLKQENEELKEENCNKCDFQKQYFDETKRLMNINRNLRLENEKLKEVIKSINKPIVFPLDEEVTNKYKQALEEIRGIVEPIKENTCFGMNCGAVDWILDKINEVLGK